MYKQQWHTMHPSPQRWEVGWRFAGGSEPNALALGIVRGAAARLSAGCACSAFGSKPWARQDAA